MSFVFLAVLVDTGYCQAGGPPGGVETALTIDPDNPAVQSRDNSLTVKRECGALIGGFKP